MRASISSCLPAFITLVASLGVGCTTGPADRTADDESEITSGVYECSAAEARGTIGADPAGFPRVVAARAAGHPGFDRFVIELSGPGATFHVAQTSTATFIQDASGEPITVPGSAGLEVVVRGVDWLNSNMVGSFSVPGAKVMTRVTPGVLFEGDLSLGIGLQRQACYHVFQLSNPSRLVVDIQTDGPVPAWKDAVLPDFTCGAFPEPANPSTIAVSPSPPSLDYASTIVRKRSGAHPDAAVPFDRFVLELAGGDAPPQAWLQAQRSASFATTGKQTVDLPGSAGLELVLGGGIETKGARRLQAAPGTTMFTGAEEIENFEGYSHWAIGLARETCYRAYTLLDPPRFVVDVKR